MVLPVVALSAAGLVGGALWAWWADPPARTEVTRTNTELLLARQFGVDGSYACLGLLLGLAVGIALTVVLRRTGWLLVLGVGVGGIAAAAVSYGSGVLWGPGPVADVSRDDALSGGLSVHVPAVFLTWPVGGVLGVLLVVWLTDRGGVDAAEPGDPGPGGRV